jgi:hypothetical protein
MKTKVITIIVVVVALLALAAFYLNYRNRTLSPPGEASVTSGGVQVSVNYSRPSVRGRLIFGTEEEERCNLMVSTGGSVQMKVRKSNSARMCCSMGSR